jgi:hypothetical protein
VGRGDGASDPMSNARPSSAAGSSRGAGRRGRHRRLGAAAVCLSASALVLTACGSGSPGAVGASARDGHRGSGGKAAPTTTPGPAATTTTTVPPQPGWTVIATESTGVAVDQRTVSLPDGATVRIIRFRAHQVHFHLHDGSQDPPAGSAPLPADGTSAISATEAPTLLAAFNGGFKTTANAGGTEIDGQVLTPLDTGKASFVINAAGQGSIGVWGQPGFPPANPQGLSVRQNLSPLVVDGAPSPTAGTWAAWGATVTNLSTVARSALGQDASGNLMYAASSSALPIDLAQALVRAGAVIGMELDINPDWVQADVAAAPGGPLAAAIPGQYPPATEYQSGWTRDFVTVLAGGSNTG